jgi:hypothetical protein
MTHPVAETILQQLGGHRRFYLMTGASNFTGSANALSFQLPRCRDGINGLRIVLERDLYTLEFLRLRSSDRVVVKSVEQVGEDDLCRVFTKTTGLHTDLGAGASVECTDDAGPAP